MLLKQDGFGLVGVMIAVGLMGIIAVGFATLTQNMAASVRSATISQQEQSLVN